MNNRYVPWIVSFVIGASIMMVWELKTLPEERPQTETASQEPQEGDTTAAATPNSHQGQDSNAGEAAESPGVANRAVRDGAQTQPSGDPADIKSSHNPDPLEPLSDSKSDSQG